MNTLPWVPFETALRQMSAMHTCAVTVCDGHGGSMTTLTPGSPPMAVQLWDRFEHAALVPTTNNAVSTRAPRRQSMESD